MMIFLKLSIFCLISFTAPIWADGNGQCYEGVQNRRGNFWYVCRQGREVPVSCIGPDGRTQFGIGQTYRSEHFVLQCTQPEPNSIQLEPIACVSSNGHVISPGNLFTADQVFYFKCVREENSLHTKLAGCVGKLGELIPSGGLVRRGQFLFKCVITGTGIKLEAHACTYDDHQYSPGQDILTPAVWYRCEIEPNGGISIKLKGCVKQGRQHAVAERFNDGNFIFQCTLEDNRIYPKPVGCMERFRNGTLAEYDPGQKWLSELADYNRYLIECQRQGAWLKRVAVQCHYSTPDGYGYLEGGCFRKVGRKLIQCLSNAQQSPNVKIKIQEPWDQASEQRLYSSGLRSC